MVAREMIRVTVWNEYRHERENSHARAHYPDGMHAVLAEALREQSGLEVTTATLDEPEHGLPSHVLDRTDVLTWWGHAAHEEVTDDIAARVRQRVLDGMGLIVLHSGHYAKVFRALMGTGCMLKWRKGEKERLWVIDRTHPIAAGLPEHFDLELEEMYGEPFQIPPPDELIFVSWFSGGEVFRSGCTFRRGRGKVFYFRPGDEDYPTYHDPHVQRVVVNAARWAAPAHGPEEVTGPADRLEPDTG